MKKIEFVLWVTLALSSSLSFADTNTYSCNANATFSNANGVNVSNQNEKNVLVKSGGAATTLSSGWNIGVTDSNVAYYCNAGCTIGTYTQTSPGQSTISAVTNYPNASKNCDSNGCDAQPTGSVSFNCALVN